MYHDWLDAAAAVAIVLGAVFGGNWVAQRLLPTHVSDPYSRRVAYRIVFMITLGAFIALAYGASLILR